MRLRDLIVVWVVLFASAVHALQPAAPLSPGSVKFRIATFDLGGVSTADLAAADVPRLHELAAAIQRIRPQVLLLNGLAYDMPGAPGITGNEPAGSNAKRFVEKYLQVAQAPDLPPLRYRVFVDQSNSGVPSGIDLNHDGKITTEFPLTADTPEQLVARAAYSADCWGPGDYPGQRGMALLVDERLEIKTSELRTFRKLPWSYMDAAYLPLGPDQKPLYTEEEKAAARLSSVGHWDVPIVLPNKSVVHFLCSNPVPPSLAGAGDISARRNHDEVRFWADYIEDSSWIVDDDGKEGGLRRGSEFVILGNLGVDPIKGEKFREPITTSLGATRMINFDFVPAAAGGSTDTCGAGLRLDYVLPAKVINVVGGGIQRWPEKGPSDHYLVWLDIAVAAP